MLPRAKYAILALLLVTICLGPWTSAHAQGSYPDKPVRLVIPYPPGGITDILARELVQRLAAVWKQPVVIDNRPGANEIVGASAVAHAAPDGYTLLLGSDAAYQWNALLYSKLPYSPEKDFAPISRLIEGPAIMVVAADLPAKTVAEYIALAKKEPGKLTYGSVGMGSTTHLRMNWFGLVTGIELNHIPYKGMPPMMQDILGGQVQSTWAPLAVVDSYLKAGKIRALAVTGKLRLPVLPEVPTMTELGYKDLDVAFVIGLVAPAGTPRPIIDKVARDVRAIVKEKEFEDKITHTYAYTVIADTPDEFAAALARNRPDILRKIQAANVHLD